MPRSYPLAGRLFAFLRRPVFWVGLALALITLIAVGRFFHWGKRVACPPEEICSVVNREYYPARDWLWTGIFPLEGGFIPDPHFTFSESMLFPGPALELLGNVDSKYQVVDVNPAFNNETSEILFVVHSGQATYVYSLDFPKKHREQAVLGFPLLPDSRVFPYRGNLAILEDFFGRGKGIYLLRLPLKSDATLYLVPVKSPEFDKIAGAFKTEAQDQAVKQQFCRTTNDFAAFYEKYAGSCGWSAAEYAANPNIHNYDGFWSQEADF